uniref:Uncharacterized protein n=1 Tax=Trichuris muris TaxID=70415 RepID=A0A5S6QBL2_TRIMR
MCDGGAVERSCTRPTTMAHEGSVERKCADDQRKRRAPLFAQLHFKINSGLRTRTAFHGCRSALRTFAYLEHRLKVDSEICAKYVVVMAEYISAGHARWLFLEEIKTGQPSRTLVAPASSSGQYKQAIRAADHLRWPRKVQRSLIECRIIELFLLDCKHGTPD